MIADHDELARIEYLGLNCELGFALQAVGHNDSALLRWCFTPPEALAPIIGANFASLYDPQNLTPAGPNLVRDTRYNIAFHTNVRTEQCGDAWCFVDGDEARRRRIFEAEQNLVSSQVAKFRKRFETRDTLYVLTRHDSNPAGPATEVIAAIAARSGEMPFYLLEILVSDEPTAVGRVEKIDEVLYRGYVGFLAPNEHANEIDLAAWKQVLSQSLTLTRAASTVA